MIGTIAIAIVSTIRKLNQYIGIQDGCYLVGFGLVGLCYFVHSLRKERREQVKFVAPAKEMLLSFSIVVFSYLCFISPTLRRWDKSAAIQELFSFLGIGTKQSV